MSKTPQTSDTPTLHRPTSGNERRRQNNRREELLAEAARLIAEKGYEGTSMRDIAAAVGMLPGSLYYHFPSKEELFVELHAQAVTSINRAVDSAVERESDPWARLEAAVAAHLEAMLETTDTIAIVSPDFPEDRSQLNARLIEQRDAYETKFARLVEDLGLSRSVDPGMFRLMLLGAVNWSPIWYRRAGKAGPAEIARAFVEMLRDACKP